MTPKHAAEKEEKKSNAYGRGLAIDFPLHSTRSLSCSGGHAANRDQRSARSVLHSLGMGKQYRDSASGSTLYSQIKVYMYIYCKNG